MAFHHAVTAGKQVLIYTEESYKAGKYAYEVPSAIEIDGKEFKFLGAGSSNVAYLSADKKIVYKEPYGEAEEEIKTLKQKNATYVSVNDPARLVAIFQSVDPGSKGKYSVIQSGYLMPYFSPDKKDAKKIQLSEQQRIDALIHFFEITKGRILCDVFVEDNLLLSNKQVRFPDVNDALEIGLNEDNQPKSPASYHAWRGINGKRAPYRSSLSKIRKEEKLSKLAATIEALITLKEQFPDLCGSSVSWLKDPKNEKLRDELADIFEKDKKLSVEEIKELKNEIETLNKGTVSRTVSRTVSGVASGDEGSLGVSLATSPGNPSSSSSSPHPGSLFGGPSPQVKKLTPQQQLSSELVKTLRGYSERFPKPDKQKIAHCKTLISLAEDLKATGIDNFALALKRSMDWNIAFEGSAVESNHDNLSFSFSFARIKSKAPPVKRFGACLQACEALLERYNHLKTPSELNSHGESPRDSFLVPK